MYWWGSSGLEAPRLTACGPREPSAIPLRSSPNRQTHNCEGQNQRLNSGVDMVAA